MNVQNMFSHGDTPVCQIWYACVKSKDTLAQTQIYHENMILIVRLKVKVTQRSCIYITHCPMMIHSCAKYGMTTSILKDKEVVARKQCNVKNLLSYSEHESTQHIAS